MTYSVEWDRVPFKILNKLEKAEVERILDKLEEVALDPFHYLQHYEGEGYKLRIGDFRLIIDVNQKEKILTVQIFDKRGKVYKKK